MADDQWDAGERKPDRGLVVEPSPFFALVEVFAVVGREDDFGTS